MDNTKEVVLEWETPVKRLELDHTFLVWKESSWAST